MPWRVDTYPSVVMVTNVYQHASGMLINLVSSSLLSKKYIMVEKVTIKARNEKRIPPSSVAALLTDITKF